MIVVSPRLGASLPLVDQLGEQLRVVDDLVAAAEVRVLVRERVEAVRAARDDLRHARARSASRRSPGRTTGRGTRCPARRAGSPVHDSRGPRIATSSPAASSSFAVEIARRARSLVERRRAADPVEDLGRRVARLQDADAEAVRPRRSLGLRLAPRVRRRARRRAASSRPRPGSRDSTMTRWRRRSTMWSTCSIETGHSCTHAPHVTQSQTTSSVTAFGTSGESSPPARAALPSAKSWSRRPMIRSFGESAFPVAYAGQTSWQRPHSVHDIASSICFHVRSATVPAPKRIAASSSDSKSSGSSRPRARVRPNKTLIAAVAMCRCFECGR